MKNAQKYLVPVIVYPVCLASAYYGLNGNEFAWNFFLFTQWLAVIIAPISLGATVLASFGVQIKILNEEMGDTFEPIPSILNTGAIVYFDIAYDIACIILCR